MYTNLLAALEREQMAAILVAYSAERVEAAVAEGEGQVKFPHTRCAWRRRVLPLEASHHLGEPR